MPTYTYRCPGCGEFDVILPMSAVQPQSPCPGCATSARRIFAAPALSTLAPGLHRMADLAAASAENPQIATRSPGPGVPSAPRRDPRYPALPTW